MQIDVYYCLGRCHKKTTASLQIVNHMSSSQLLDHNRIRYLLPLLILERSLPKTCSLFLADQDGGSCKPGAGSPHFAN